MRIDQDLYRLLSLYIETQITKYNKLARIGIGPDADINAHLVASAVTELLGLKKQLLETIKSNRGITLNNRVLVVNIFNQFRFYIEQEYLRGSAGLLLDENNIHFNELERVSNQLEDLKKFAATAEFDMSSPAQAVSDLQKQCEHDSNAIAAYILSLAIEVRNNPDMVMDSQFLPDHAQKIIRGHAKTRYCDPDISKKIDELHKKCTDYLSTSQLQKSNTKLTTEEANQLEQIHRAEFNAMLKQFNLLDPYFTVNSKSDKSLPSQIQPEKKTSPFSSRLCFFSGAVSIFSVLTYVFMQYMNHSNEGPGLANKS